MNNSTFYLVSGVISLGYTMYSGLKYYSLTGEGLVSSTEARDMLRKKEIDYIIDVRTDMEYRRGHYKKSLNIPITELTNKSLKNIRKNSKILIYCNTGQRARRASDRMRDMGYKNVYYIDGSYKGLL
jgi:rhodanese-related sulfurtransferase